MFFLFPLSLIYFGLKCLYILISSFVLIKFGFRNPLSPFPSIPQKKAPFQEKRFIKKVLDTTSTFPISIALIQPENGRKHFIPIYLRSQVRFSSYPTRIIHFQNPFSTLPLPSAKASFLAKSFSKKSWTQSKNYTIPFR